MLSCVALCALLHRVIVRIVVGHCTHCMCLLALNFSLCHVVRTVALYALYCTGLCAFCFCSGRCNCGTKSTVEAPRRQPCNTVLSPFGFENVGVGSFSCLASFPTDQYISFWIIHMWCSEGSSIPRALRRLPGLILGFV